MYCFIVKDIESQTSFRTINHRIQCYICHAPNAECVWWQPRTPLWCRFYHDAHGHQQKGTAVLWKQYCQEVGQHSQVSLRYLSLLWDTVLLTKANTIITLEGSRLQPGDASQPTRVRHQPYASDEDEP